MVDVPKSAETDQEERQNASDQAEPISTGPCDDSRERSQAFQRHSSGRIESICHDGTITLFCPTREKKRMIRAAPLQRDLHWLRMTFWRGTAHVLDDLEKTLVSAGCRRCRRLSKSAYSSRTSRTSMP